MRAPAWLMLLACVAWPLSASAHGGGLDANGCHTNSQKERTRAVRPNCGALCVL